MAMYIDNKKFTIALGEYSDQFRDDKLNERPRTKMPEYIGECIIKTANKVANRGQYINYSYKDEMISDAIINAFLYIHNFNIEKSQNGFAYLTSMLSQSCVKRINIERKQQYVKAKCFTNGYTDEINNHIDDKTIKDEMDQMYVDFNSNCSEFEERIKEKKIKMEKIKEDLSPIVVDIDEKVETPTLEKFF